MDRTTKKQFLRALARPWRLLALAALIALLFSTARLYVLTAIVAVALVGLVRSPSKSRARWAWALGILLAMAMTVQIVANVSDSRWAAFAEANTPIDLVHIPDGSYEGAAPGANAEIRASVAVKDGRIDAVEILETREPVYAFDAVLPRLIGRDSTAFPETNAFVFRNDQSVDGLRRAIENALLPALAAAPTPGPVARAAFFVSSNEFGRIAVNAMAILFIVLLAFDYALGPVLNPGTGQALNCYNCQACVGVCPIKNAEGVPFPMGMVLETRLGRYENVRHLATYCVGCGRCAAKCPVGNSGPSIAAAAIARLREQKQSDPTEEPA